MYSDQSVLDDNNKGNNIIEAKNILFNIAVGLVFLAVGLPIVYYKTTPKEYDDNNTKCTVNPVFCTNLRGNPITGYRMAYYANGQLKTKSFHKDGYVEGDSLGYYKNGKIQAKFFYKNGFRDGIGTMYYPNGKILEQDSFKMGKQHGILKKYYENGQLKVEGSFENGQPVGIHKIYDKQGSLEATQSFKNGQMEYSKREKPDTDCIRRKTATKNMAWYDCIHNNVSPSYLSGLESMKNMEACKYMMEHWFDECYEYYYPEEDNSFLFED